jgi:hypothetical protein
MWRAMEGRDSDKGKGKRGKDQDRQGRALLKHKTAAASSWDEVGRRYRIKKKKKVGKGGLQVGAKMRSSKQPSQVLLEAGKRRNFF